jgi:hypothetical protein
MGQSDEYEGLRRYYPRYEEYGELTGVEDGMVIDTKLYGTDLLLNKAPVDTFGNIRVIRVYWKSLRKILKVKSYDPETGDEVYNFYPENYTVDETMGEEAEAL